MIKIYLYQLKLLDPLFYAREGLAGAYTPPYLHATAVNLAVKSALNLDPELQPLLVLNNNGKRTTPMYSNSLVAKDFYFTPARLVTPLEYFSEITKGENDGYVFKTKEGELFQAGILHYIPPEAIFEGYLIERKPYNWPVLIRLGSFRGKAVLTFYELEIIKPLKELSTVSHPVDPLVTSVKRGILINMFPYPLVENARTFYGVVARGEGGIHVVAFPDEWEVPKIEIVKVSNKVPII